MAKTSTTTVTPNGQLIAFARDERGWTQQELADKAGYSDRLIRKAEASGSIRRDTLEDLAEALSTDALPLSIVDLMSDYESIMWQWIRGYAKAEHQTVARCNELMSESMQLWAAGDGEVLPFAGHFDGLDEVDGYLQAFFSALERPDKELYCHGRVMSHGKDVVFLTQDTVRMVGTDTVFTRPIFASIRFEDGQIATMNSMFDGVGLTKFVERKAESEQRRLREAA